MTTLFLDLETFSTVDIKAGVYQYSTKAEIMLFAWALDDGPSQVWDKMVDPGRSPDHALLQAFNDPDVELVAHNAQFDRVILNATGATTDLSRWRCTMAQAQAHGFPGSLDRLGRILGLPDDKAKSSEGKKLINRFCSPAPANHNADRYSHKTHPEEWARFSEYARRDIDAMREVAARLPDWNYKNGEVDLWRLDQRINDRGFAVDRELVEAGAKAADAEKTALTERFQELTGGAVGKPTQRAKFQEYLNDTFGLQLEDTRSNTFAQMLKGNLPDDCAELMQLSMMANKTSTAKYKALLPAIGKDSRFRGGLQFAGAQRTRRWCLTGDHEVLTENGWQRIDQWHGGTIAQWRAGKILFEHADRVEFEYQGDVLAAQRIGRIDAVMTPEHVLCAESGTSRMTAGAAFGHHVTGVERHGVLHREPVSTIRTRVLVMLQHDGYVSGNTVAWSFKKKRKSTRCQKLLASAGIPFTVSKTASDVYRVYVPTATKPDWLVKRDFGPWLLSERHDPRTFIAEIEHWDGGNRRDKQIEVCSKARVNAEWTATMAHLAGFSATFSKRSNDYWFVCVSKSGNKVSIKPGDWSRSFFSGSVYCAATRTGFFLVRRNGVVHVTGNSGRGFQPHNLPSRGLPPQKAVERYIDALKLNCHDFLFDDLMLHGSAALRGVLVAPEGRKLVVSDLSNIEGRVNAWLAGETWKLKAFAAFDRGEGPDLYNVTAGQLLGKDPYDIDKTERNVLGKVPELALGYEGGVGAFQTFSKAYGVQMVDHWSTIQRTLGRDAVDRAYFNWDKWGEARNDGVVEKTEWLASETVKLAWRSRHPKIVELWKSCKEAATKALENRGKTYTAGAHLKFKAVIYGGWLYLLMRMPSGNFLVYFDPKISETDGTLTYMGVDPLTSQWARTHTYGGKLVENACQSFARDVLASSMAPAEAAGFDVLLTVHDEIVTETDEARNVDELSALMATVPAYAQGLPLAAAGFEATRYRKD